ncbi:MAG TPA: STAS domain-containing protein [Terriglobales bacterium]|nr:STAS domain-containing protein [Terriglobales bacterium]
MVDTRDFELNVRPGSVADSTVIAAKGPMVLEHLFRFQDAWRNDQSAILVFDLTEVSYMDSSMIGSLVNAHVHRSRNGRKLALAAVPDRVKQFLSVTNVDKLFQFYATVSEAEAALTHDSVQAR